MSFINTLQTAKQFASKACASESTRNRKKQEKKAILNALLFPAFSNKWFQMLHEDKFNNYFMHRNRLYLKPYSPYINTNWNKEKKVKVIGDSIEFLETKTNFADDFKRYKEIILANVPLKDNTIASLILHYDNILRKEGEFTVSLIKDDNKIISLAFSIGKTAQNNYVAYVGCVQGHSVENKELTKNIHKLLHAIRPKSFIVFVSQKLFEVLGCKDIFFVDNKSRPHTGKHLIKLPWIHDITFDNDTTWQELGGVSISGGWYKFPLVAQRKPLEEVKSKKRSQYKKRYELLDDVYIQIEKAVAK